jgi:hypothetical protein
MSETSNVLTSNENLTRVLDLFTDENVFGLTVNDVSNLTGLNQPTSRRALNGLVRLGKLSEVGYKPRTGKIYAPVATSITVRLGDMDLSVKQVLEYLVRNETSPFNFVNAEAWKMIRQLILWKLFAKSSRVEIPVDDDAMSAFAISSRDKVREFYKLLDSLEGIDFGDETKMVKVGAELDSMPEAFNTYQAIMGSIESSAA